MSFTPYYEHKRGQKAKKKKKTYLTEFLNCSLQRKFLLFKLLDLIEETKAKAQKKVQSIQPTCTVHSSTPEKQKEK